MASTNLAWQSKTILLIVFPFVGADLVLETHWWATQTPAVATWTVGLSALLGLIAYKTHSATPSAALSGAAVTASLMFATVRFPYLPWRSALVPVLVLLLLTSLATRAGRRQKEDLGIAENRRGRKASQVAANLGVATIVSNPLVLSWLTEHGWGHSRIGADVGFILGLATLAEAAADTISSEVGQVLSGHPHMITTFRKVEPGTDGAISMGGTAAGIIAAGAVAVSGTWALGGDWRMLAVSWAGGVFGLLFDSLLGATAELRGWINNDAVNFLSTASAAAAALGLVAIVGPRWQ